MKAPVLYGEHPILAEAEAEWLTPEPGIHIRFAKWTGGDKGTIHIFNGRTEYIEKYAELIAKFVKRGYTVTAHDWRGQGLSTRNSLHPQRSHIDDFAEFQRDADAVMKASADLPHPRRLFCHSMGGAIGTHYLMRTKNIQSAVFSAPMWGIYVPMTLRTFLRPINWAVNHWNAQWRCVVGTSDEAYELQTPYRANQLTTDPKQYQKLQDNLKLFPELSLGGPTYYWYYAALQEMEMLAQSDFPSMPALVFLGTKEKIVDAKTIKSFAAKHNQIRLVSLKGAKHETYLETPEVQKQFWSHLESFWFTN